MSKQFIETWNELASSVHSLAKEKGWWGEGEIDQDLNNPQVYFRIAASIALMHSELSEGLEGVRAGNPPDDKIPEFNTLEAEFADVVIRIMDAAEARGLKVAEAIVAKTDFNRGRKYKHGGKKF